jgi:hypothetical protein
VPDLDDAAAVALAIMSAMISKSDMGCLSLEVRGVSFCGVCGAVEEEIVRVGSLSPAVLGDSCIDALPDESEETESPSFSEELFLIP